MLSAVSVMLTSYPPALTRLERCEISNADEYYLCSDAKCYDADELHLCSDAERSEDQLSVDTDIQVLLRLLDGRTEVMTLSPSALPQILRC